jgi:hypothetical protein
MSSKDLSLSHERRTRLPERRGLIARIFHQGDGAGGAAPNSLSCSKGDSDDTPLCEIIELGREALRQKRSDEVAFDLLGLDGVWLPLEAKRASNDGARWRIAGIHWLDRI